MTKRPDMVIRGNVYIYSHTYTNRQFFMVSIRYEAMCVDFAFYFLLSHHAYIAIRVAIGLILSYHSLNTFILMKVNAYFDHLCNQIQNKIVEVKNKTFIPKSICIKKNSIKNNDNDLINTFLYNGEILLYVG